MFAPTGLIFSLLLLIMVVGFAASLGWFAGIAWGSHPLLAAHATAAAVVYILWIHTAAKPSSLGWILALLCSAAAFAAGIRGARPVLSQQRVTSQ